MSALARRLDAEQPLPRRRSYDNVPQDVGVLPALWIDLCQIAHEARHEWNWTHWFSLGALLVIGLIGSAVAFTDTGANLYFALLGWKS